MRLVVESIAGEYRRYKTAAEQTFDQLTDAQLCERIGPIDNSIATIVWHVAGNLRSRFTDFLTADGEKPWRDRESEFLQRRVTGAELRAYWDEGWAPLMGALVTLTDEDLPHTIHIRNQPLQVVEALHRSLAHTSNHVGQIVYIGKHLCAKDWNYLSIPPGQSAGYNQNPTLERPPVSPRR